MALGGVASAAVQMGDTELDAMVGWMSQSGKSGGPDIDAWWLQGGVNYFITDNVQVGGRVMGYWTRTELKIVEEVEFDGDTFDLSGKAKADVDLYGLGARAAYHFMPTNQWVPYVGGQFMWAKAKISGKAGGTTVIREKPDGWLWGPIAGLRYELNAYNDFYVEYQYHRWDGDIGKAVRDGHALFAGIVHQFK